MSNETTEEPATSPPIPDGYARFHGNGGYTHDKEQAKGVLKVGNDYKVTDGRMYSWNTDLVLEGIEGKWNSALFDVDISTTPIEI